MMKNNEQNKAKQKAVRVIPPVSFLARSINKVVVLSLVLIAFGVGLLLYWAAQSDDVLQLNYDPIPIRTIRNHPTAGGVVILNLDYCKYSSNHGDMRISFVSASNEVFLPVQVETAKEGCHKHEFPVLIPKNLTPNTYRIKISVMYDTNPLKQDINEVFYSLPVVIDPTISLEDKQE